MISAVAFASLVAAIATISFEHDVISSYAGGADVARK